MREILIENSSVTNDDKVAEIMSSLKYEQHMQKFVREVLEDYPSLQDQMLSCIHNGMTRVVFYYEHGILKPVIREYDKNILVCINH